jgi:hypothetical protein
MEMSIDVEELHLFDGIASCANHSVNFKIGMSFIFQLKTIISNLIPFKALTFNIIS